MTAAPDLPNEFRSWVLDPARTNDELFTVALLLEDVTSSWRIRHQIYDQESYEERRARVPERAGNPAWRPRFSAEQFEQAAELWEGVTHLFARHRDDRAVCDLKALRFFPNLADVALHEAEIADLSPLAGLTELRKLTLQEPHLRMTHGLGSLDPLGRLEKVETLSLSLRAAWPDLSPLGRMPALETLAYRGNPLALAAIAALPRVRFATFHADFHWKTPLRSLRELPAMPELERLTLEAAGDLAGIERFPRLINLSLQGPFRSLEPLAALAHVTFLRLEGEHFWDVSPLARMPALQQVVFVREEPLALESLAEAPALREVLYERCAIIRTELAALNAALPPWSDSFLLGEPRKLPPLRFMTYRPQLDETREYRKLKPHGNDWEIAELKDDPALAQRHNVWFEAEVTRRLDELLGRGWRSRDLPGHPTFGRYRDVVRLREIVGMLRAFLAECRYPRQIMLCFEPHGDMNEEMQEIAARQGDEEDRDWLDEPFDAEEQRQQYEEFRQRRREEFQRRARAHRLRLLEEQGVAIDPAEFSTIPEPPKEKATAGNVPGSPEIPPAPEDADEDEDGGGLAIPPPPEGEASEFVQDLSFIVNLRWDILWVTEHMRENAEYHWGEPAENWHALPCPLADRPEPH